MSDGTGFALGLTAGLVGAALFGVGAVAQAHAVRRQPGSPDRLLDFVRRSLRDGWTMLVVLAYLAGFLLHAVAIWLLPLYLAQAAVSMSLPVTALASRRVGEHLHAAQWLAVGAVTAGLALLSLGAGRAGDVVTDPLFVAPLWVGFGLLAAVALGRGRLRGGGLGALAGLGYAGSAIAVRGVALPVDGVTVAAALAVPAFSLVAFWLYSLGMNDSAVSSATAPLIVGQTFVPSAVGVVLLGDTVRDGWWPAVVLGLLLATYGAVQLGRAVPRSEVPSLG